MYFLGLRRKHPDEKWSMYWLGTRFSINFHWRCLWHYGILRRYGQLDWRGRINEDYFRDMEERVRSSKFLDSRE